MTILRIYTDGACSGNQNKNNIGGWGAILEFGNHKKELYDSAIDTTNNIMEMTAVIQGLKALNRKVDKIQIFSDSAYVVNCMQQKWHISWQKNGWKTASKQPVANIDLWKELLQLIDLYQPEFYKVKGHVNLNHPSVDLNKHYEKFLSLNKCHFTFDDFHHITEMNNRADELANIAMDAIR